MPPVDDILTVEPQISWTVNCIPMLQIRVGKTWRSWFLSPQRARVIVNALDEVRHFVETEGSEAWFHFQDTHDPEKMHPVLMLENSETTSQKYHYVSFGLHKAKLVLHWLPYIQQFVESQGESSIPTEKTLNVN